MAKDQPKKHVVAKVVRTVAKHVNVRAAARKVDQILAADGVQKNLNEQGENR